MAAAPSGPNWTPLPTTPIQKEIVDKKEILRTVSNTAVYCSNGKVGTVYVA
jgi:hypothetical protein